jgi:hypothetical protein
MQENDYTDYITEETHCVFHVNVPKNEVSNKYINFEDFPYHIMGCLNNLQTTELLDIHDDGTEIYRSGYQYEKLYVIHPVTDPSLGYRSGQTVVLPNHGEDCCWNDSDSE